MTDGKTAGFLKLMLVKAARWVSPSSAQVQRESALGAGDVGAAEAGALVTMIAPYPRAARFPSAAGAYFSPKLFDNMALKQVVRLVQRLLPGDCSTMRRGFFPDRADI